MPSGPELSKTRLTTLPTERLRLFLFRERDLEDLMRISVFGFISYGRTGRLGRRVRRKMAALSPRCKWFSEALACSARLATPLQ